MGRGDRGNHFSLRRGAILFAIIICCKGRKKHVLREIYSYTFYMKDKFMDKITIGGVIWDDEYTIDELIFKNGVYYYNQNSEEWEEDDEKA